MEGLVFLLKVVIERNRVLLLQFKNSYVDLYEKPQLVLEHALLW